MLDWQLAAARVPRRPRRPRSGGARPQRGGKLAVLCVLVASDADQGRLYWHCSALLLYCRCAGRARPRRAAAVGRRTRRIWSRILPLGALACPAQEELSAHLRMHAPSSGIKSRVYLSQQSLPASLPQSRAGGLATDTKEVVEGKDAVAAACSERAERMTARPQKCCGALHGCTSHATTATRAGGASGSHGRARARRR